MWRFGLEEWGVWMGGIEGLLKERKKVQMGGQMGWGDRWMHRQGEEMMGGRCREGRDGGGAQDFSDLGTWLDSERIESREEGG